MSANTNIKLKLLYLMDILLDKTDENNHITVKEIITELSRYGISAERKSIYSDIEILKTYGLDIICEKGRSNKYFIGSRVFELAELKLLVDYVNASKFITNKKSKELIKKLKKLTSINQAKKLDRYIIIKDNIKTKNERIFYNVDTLHRAIHENKKVQFKYFDYNLDKEFEFRKGGEKYIANPYALTWIEDNYYLIGCYDECSEISNLRVDRMMDIELLDQDRYIIEGYKNSRKISNMYNGELERLELEFDNSLINEVIDKFGETILIRKNDNNSFTIKVEVEVSDKFLGWLFSFGDGVRIISPDSCKIRMKQMTKNVLKLY